MAASLFLDAPVFSTGADLHAHYREVRRRLRSAAVCKQAPPSLVRVVFSVVCCECSVTRAQMVGVERGKKIAGARALVAYLLREMGGNNFATIGRRLNGSRAAALYAHAKVARRLALDEEFAVNVAALRNRVAAVAPHAGAMAGLQPRPSPFRRRAETGAGRE
jgi:hypothetical protein